MTFILKFYFIVHLGLKMAEYDELAQAKMRKQQGYFYFVLTNCGLPLPK
jgi:hypothetical protein